MAVCRPPLDRVDFLDLLLKFVGLTPPAYESERRPGREQEDERQYAFETPEGGVLLPYQDRNQNHACEE